MANVFNSEATLIVYSNEGEQLEIPAKSYTTRFNHFTLIDETDIRDANVTTLMPYDYDPIALEISGVDLAARFNKATGGKPKVNLLDVSGPEVFQRIYERHGLKV